jgi:hypothetical protein
VRGHFSGAGHSDLGDALLTPSSGELKLEPGYPERPYSRYRSRFSHREEHAWSHFVDHEHGAWYRILTADNCRISDEKSPAGKVDYHTMGVCYDVLPLLARRRAARGEKGE